MKEIQKRRRLRTKGPVQNQGYLEGQLLIAMPGMTDKRFSRSVIYVCSHTPRSAMGLIINQRADHITFPSLLEKLNLVDEATADDRTGDLLDKDVHVGGPVETSRGFVLHSSDYFIDDSTLRIHDGICLTATLDILKAIATGKGPGQSILALGYAGWSAGQLDSEILANGWLHCPADPDIIFAEDIGEKYERALATIGVDPCHLVSVAGHA